MRCGPTGATCRGWWPRSLARTGAPDLALRIIGYHLHGDQGTVTVMVAPATTLLDPLAAPARLLAEPDQQRWLVETAVGASRSSFEGDGVVLRSKTPAGAEQECCSLPCARPAIRDATRYGCPSLTRWTRSAARAVTRAVASPGPADASPDGAHHAAPPRDGCPSATSSDSEPAVQYEVKTFVPGPEIVARASRAARSTSTGT